MSKQSVSRVLFFERVTHFRNNDHSSSLAVADEIKRPTRELERTTLNVPLFGLAPGGVYKASAVTDGTGELLPHLFTLTPYRTPKRPYQRRFPFCCTVLPVAGTGRYPALCPVEPGLSSPLSGGGHLFYFGIPGLTYEIRFKVADNVHPLPST